MNYPDGANNRWAPWKEPIDDREDDDMIESFNLMEYEDRMHEKISAGVYDITIVSSSCCDENENEEYYYSLLAENEEHAKEEAMKDFSRDYGLEVFKIESRKK